VSESPKEMKSSHMMLMDYRRLKGATLCMISVLTPFNTEKYLVYLCQRKHSLLA